MQNQVITIDHLSTIIMSIKTDSKISDSIKSGIKEILEISSGNVNQVFKILFNNDFSCVAKYAPPFAYRYQDIAIANERNAFEVDVLTRFFKENKENYPEIYYFCESNHLMLMQDLSMCFDMREALIQGEVFNNFSHDMVNIFSLYPKNINRDQKAGNTHFLYSHGIPELQNITKDFVFCCPFGLKFPEGVICLEENMSWVKENIFNNILVLNIRSELETLYNNKLETLLHGDLHTGSIMINQKSIYLIDPEFSKLGPISFDIGMLLGNLIMSYLSANYHLRSKFDKKENFQNWLFDCIQSLWGNTVEKLSNNGFNKRILLSEIGGYCGIEIIRRTIGAAKVKDFTSIIDNQIRHDIELTALKYAVWLIENFNKESIIEEFMIKLNTFG